MSYDMGWCDLFWLARAWAGERKEERIDRIKS